MAHYRVLDHTNPILRRVASPVERIDQKVREIAHNLRETMIAYEGVGLAAPQVGIPERIIVFRNQENKPEGVLINPVLVTSTGEEIGNEGCLSIPGLYGQVPRAQEVMVEGLNLSGKSVKIVAEGFLARVLQHEIDHLDGILFIDRAIPETLRRYVPEEALAI